MRGQLHINDIGQFQDVSYVSTSKALWRLFQFEVIKEKRQTWYRTLIFLKIITDYIFGKGTKAKWQANFRLGTKITE